MSPAIDAAIATTQPTTSAATLPESSVQPSSRKTVEVSIREAMVMPLVGFEVTPTRPTMRDETVTKKKAQTTTSTAARARTGKVSSGPKVCGTSAISRASAAEAAEDQAERQVAAGARDRRGVFTA